MLIHSDNGAEFKNKLYKDYCERTGNIQSYNNTGKAKDNASMESFFSTVEREILNSELYSKEEVIRLFNWYMDFYNNMRLHSSLGYLTPTEYKKNQLTGVN